MPSPLLLTLLFNYRHRHSNRNPTPQPHSPLNQLNYQQFRQHLIHINLHLPTLSPTKHPRNLRPTTPPGHYPLHPASNQKDLADLHLQLRPVYPLPQAFGETLNAHHRAASENIAIQIPIHCSLSDISSHVSFTNSITFTPQSDSASHQSTARSQVTTTTTNAATTPPPATNPSHTPQHGSHRPPQRSITLKPNPQSRPKTATDPPSTAADHSAPSAPPKPPPPPPPAPTIPQAPLPVQRRPPNFPAPRFRRPTDPEQLEVFHWLNQHSRPMHIRNDLKSTGSSSPQHFALHRFSATHTFQME